MSRITFTRNHPADIRHRYALISIDGKFAQKMAFGDSFSQDVSPGEHTIEGKNELGKTTQITVTVPENGNVNIRVGAVPKGCFTVLMWVFPPAPTIELEMIS